MDSKLDAQNSVLDAGLAALSLEMRYCADAEHDG